MDSLLLIWMVVWLAALTSKRNGQHLHDISTYPTAEKDAAELERKTRHQHDRAVGVISLKSPVRDTMPV